MKKHIEIKHRGKTFKCKHCNSNDDEKKIFKSANGLRNHYKIFHGEEYIKIKSNGEQQIIAESDKKNKLRNDGTDWKRNKCNYCGKNLGPLYGTKGQNYQSKKIHLKECEDYLKLTFVCNLCQKRFTKEENLTLHVQAIHEHVKAYK